MKTTRCTTGTLRVAVLGAAFLCATTFPRPLAAETGAEGWLRYSKLNPQAAEGYRRFPDKVVLLGDSLMLKTAQQELSRGMEQMSGRALRPEPGSSPQNAVVLGALKDLDALSSGLRPPRELSGDGYWLKSAKIHGSECLIIAGGTDRGVLYGVFRLLSKIARAESLAAIDEAQQPFAAVRWVNQWDNLDGRIERGYGGPSIFFENGNVRSDLGRAGQCWLRSASMDAPSTT